MNASTSGRAALRAAERVALRVVLISLLVAPATAQERTTAVWKEQEISFLYRSSTSIYECDALRRRVASILLAVGARGDLQVKVENCRHYVVTPDHDPTDTWMDPADRYRSSGLERWRRDPNDEQTANVRIRLATPVEVTAEVLDEVKKEKTRRELIARVTGNPAAVQQMTGEFPAEWREVTLSRSTIGLEPEECELLDQMSSSVFRQLGIREVARGMTCNPRQRSNIPPKLTVKALITAPFAPSVPQEEPTEDKASGRPNPSDSDNSPSDSER
jgi:hypothetical protein